MIGAREEPIPDQTRSEMLEESKAQLRKAFGDEDLSDLCSSPRRQRRCAYASVDELLATEFKADDCPDDARYSAPAASCMPEGRSADPSFMDFDTQFDQKYKMVLRECVPLESHMQPKREVVSKSVTGFKNKKNLVNKCIRNMHKSEASRKLLQRSIACQLRDQQIDSHYRCVFSLGKHLYSNTLSGKLKLVIGDETAKPLASPLVRSFRKLQECSIYDRAATLAGKKYQLVAQENCFDSCSQTTETPNSSYLAFFEEDVLVNMTVGQKGNNFSLQSLQILVADSLSGDIKRSVIREITSSLGLLRESHGGETRLGDLLRLFQIKIKNQTIKKTES